jgi:hypothetical protein
MDTPQKIEKNFTQAAIRYKTHLTSSLSCIGECCGGNVALDTRRRWAG